MLVATVLGVALALLTSTGASAQNVRIRHSFFGAHDSTDFSYSRIHEGAVRLWSVGVRWEDIELTKGHYTWTRLDQLVTDAQQAHAEVTMVVAMTPRWYASKDTNPPTTVKPYKRFVRALMQRYKSFHGSRGIAAYQVWNEANIKTYWTGSLTKLAALTKAIHHAALLPPAPRGQARLAVRRRGGAQPVPPPDLRPPHRGARGLDQAAPPGAAPPAPGGRARIEGHLEHRGQLRHGDRRARDRAPDL
jgi:hypothetical protein